MTDWTPEEDEAFNEVEKSSNLGKQILRGIEGQPYVYPPQRTWGGLSNEEIEGAIDDGFAFGLNDGNVSNEYVIRYVRVIEAKLKEKNT